MTGGGADATSGGADATAFDRAVRRLANPPAWLHAAVDGDAVLRALHRDAHALDGVVDGAGAGAGAGVRHLRADDVVACAPLDVRLGRDGWLGWYALTVRDTTVRDTTVRDTAVHDRTGATRRVEVHGTLHPPSPARAGGPAELPVLRLLPVPAGGDLPALGVLTDPAAAAALLERVVGDGARPGLRITGCTARVVRHARAARVTVMLEPRYPDAAVPDVAVPDVAVRDPVARQRPATVVAKAYRDDEGAATHTAMTALWASPLARSGVVAIAEPLGYDPELGVLLQGAVPSTRTLTELVVAAVGDGSDAALDRLRGALRRTADGLVAVHASGVSGGPARTPDALAARVRRAARRLGDVLPDAAATADALVAPLLDAAGRRPADPAVPSHGGFRPAQVLLDDADRPGFIDLDGFCRAEPAFDLGRFRARLREIVLAAPGGHDAPLSPGRRRLADALADVVLDRYVGAAPVSTERVAVWEALELATALVQSWTRAQVTRTPPLAALLRATTG